MSIGFLVQKMGVSGRASSQSDRRRVYPGWATTLLTHHSSRGLPPGVPSPWSGSETNRHPASSEARYRSQGPPLRMMLSCSLKGWTYVYLKWQSQNSSLRPLSRRVLSGVSLGGCRFDRRQTPKASQGRCQSGRSPCHHGRRPASWSSGRI